MMKAALALMLALVLAGCATTPCDLEGSPSGCVKPTPEQCSVLAPNEPCEELFYFLNGLF